MPIAIDKEQIFQEELNKVKSSNLFHGVTVRNEPFGFEGIQRRELDLHQELTNVDPELGIAVQNETRGYGKI